MEADLDDGRRPRRRPRSIVFFDHGEPSRGEKKLEAADKIRPWPRWHVNWPRFHWIKYFRIVRFVLQAIVLWFTVLTLGGLLLRGLGSFCRHTPLSPAICNSQWITSQEPVLAKYSPGKTPTTKPLQELSKLNEISPSLQTLGLVMNLVNTNLSSSYEELYAFSDIFQLSKVDLENLAVATHHTQDIVEQFSNEEYFYRSSSLLWNQNGINVLGTGVDVFREALNDSSTWTLAFSEHALHRVPYAGGWSLSRNLLKEYFYFVGEQELAVRELVVQATEVDFVLGGLLGLFGQLERKLERVVEERGRVCGNEISEDKGKLCVLDQSHQLRAATSMRAAVQWSQDVVKVAEAHYKNLLSELSSTLEVLRSDMRGYRSRFPSKSVLSLRHLNETLVTERKQIDAFVQTAEKAEEVLDSFGDGFLGGDEEGDVAWPQQLKDAVAKRQLQWW
ncbi:hypothetical protein M409DRAFT_22654 [Zasmidium cellare ATCC 36951]|uniref:Uncharacterized protein n=1 Tax=Zasmidium cellare ATCC 36951 TaxID=1080233 RepID=A0A6A6CP18_ZASCE|nr:uncharacterized protein M409DRAFT_22654 [Zasmidium cellare ATCC 36951]KAF2167226.1 hypothetical protein M409DRAFT_22654 [Zasmidium cellare ATCC 36951]